MDNIRFPHPQNINYNSQIPNSQFSNPFYPFTQNSQYQIPHVQNFQTTPQFETQQTPTNNQNSPQSEFSGFDDTNTIDLNNNCDDLDDARDRIGQWKWIEDKLLISAWLNESVDPIIGADQKGETFWERIRQYCEESNPGLIKRGIIAIKKRWHRINEGAQRYGSCYEQAERRIGSGSNLDNIVELAHELHKAKYKKKSNYDMHWNELRRQPKWITPLTNSGSAKRTKINDSGAYSSSTNNDTPTNDNDAAQSPVRPKGTKTAKRKGKTKSQELEEIKAIECRKLSLLEDFNKNYQKENDLKIIMADTTVMNEAQLEVHASLLQEIRSRRT
ncbi:glutathione S-transferase T2-like [Apium graveolens]|uniref:glutathione S-transferase T2-like n=1 Tax=Apium graveolens TaxID=4045 RepID=UPI003D7A7ABE